MIKRFVSMMISIVMIVMMIPAVAVFADGGDEIPEIKLNEKGYVQFDGKTGITNEQYILELERPAVVRFDAGTYSHMMKVYQILPDGGTHSMGGSNSTSVKYLGTGKYIFEITMHSSGPELTAHTIDIEAYYLEAHLTKDGEERVLPILPSTFYPVQVMVEKTSSVTVEIKATEGFEYSYDWYDYGTGGESDNNKFVINGFEKADCWVNLTVSSERSSIPLDFSFLLDPHLVFEQSANFLADTHSNVTYDPQIKADPEYDTLVMSWFLNNNLPPFEFKDLTYFEAVQIYGSVSNPGDTDDVLDAKTCYLYLFVLYPENLKKLDLDKEVSVNVTRMNLFNGEAGTAGEVDKYEKIFSFTPEKTGTYTFSSKGIADTYGAVFDSDRKCIACNDDLKGTYEEQYPDIRTNWRKSLNGTEDLNFSITCDLTAGKTYYLAATLNPFNDDFKKDSYDFTVSLTCDKVADTPTPTATDKPTENPTNTPTTKPTVEPVKEVSFEDFVERLYVVALGRASEPEGKAFWCEHVGNGDLNGAQCANEFLLSKEFNDRGLSDEEFLKVLYKTFFDRDAKDDPNGFNFWMNSLKTEGRDKVVDGFINSEEWCNICATYGVKSGATRAKATIASKNAIAFAERLYTKCLGRDAEAEGLKFWSLGLTNLELTGSQAAHEFFFSKEFNDHNYDNKELITRMYRTFMGREPEEEGMNFWLDSMKNGMTKEQVFNEFVKSAEFTQICKDYAIDRG